MRLVRKPNRRHSGDKSESPRLCRGKRKLRDTVSGSRILMTVSEQVYDRWYDHYPKQLNTP